MKDVTHHLRYLQKKVIQASRRSAQQEIQPEKNGNKSTSKINGNMNHNSEKMSLEQSQPRLNKKAA